jgi:hypothetical protein
MDLRLVLRIAGELAMRSGDCARPIALCVG